VHWRNRHSRLAKRQWGSNCRGVAAREARQQLGLTVCAALGVLEALHDWQHGAGVGVVAQRALHLQGSSSRGVCIVCKQFGHGSGSARQKSVGQTTWILIICVYKRHAVGYSSPQRLAQTTIQRLAQTTIHLASGGSCILNITQTLHAECHQLSG
jgi:hypothetical protein